MTPDVPAELILRLLTERPLWLRLLDAQEDELSGGGYQPIRLVPLAWSIEDGVASHPPCEFKFTGPPLAPPRYYRITHPDFPDLPIGTRELSEDTDPRRPGDVIEIPPSIRVKGV